MCKLFLHSSFSHLVCKLFHHDWQFMCKLFLNVLTCCVNVFCFSCVNFVPTFSAHCTLVSKPSVNFISVSRRARSCACRGPLPLCTACRGTAQRSFVSHFSTAFPAAVGCPMELRFTCFKASEVDFRSVCVVQELVKYHLVRETRIWLGRVPEKESGK